MWDNGGMSPAAWVWQFDFTEMSWKNNEIKFLRPVAGCTLYGHKTHEETREELNTYNLNESIVDCRCNWTQQLLRVNDTHISKLLCEYTLAGRRKKVTQGKDRQTRPVACTLLPLMIRTCFLVALIREVEVYVSLWALESCVFCICSEL